MIIFNNFDKIKKFLITMLLTWLVIESIREPFLSRPNKCFDCERQIDPSKMNYSGAFNNKCFSCEKEVSYYYGSTKCFKCKCNKKNLKKENLSWMNVMK